MMSGKNIAKAVITVGLLLIILEVVDLDKIDVRLEDISIAPIIAAAILLILQLIFLRAARWNWILSVLDRSLPYSQACILTGVSQFFNQVLPSTVGGDGVRIVMLHREGWQLKTAIHSVLLDRVFGITALLAVCCVTLPVLMLLEPEATILASLLTICVPSLVFGLMLPWAARVPALLFRGRLGTTLSQFALSAHVIWNRYRAAGSLLVLSICGHLFLSLSAWLLAQSISVELPFGEGMLILPAVFLMTAVPVSLGGWGVREGGMILALGTLGIAPESALLVSVIYGLGELLVCSAGGALWLLRREQRRTDATRGQARILNSTAPHATP